MPLFQPKGIVLWDKIMAFWKSCHKKTYLEIKTPIMLNRDLWVTSGHWDNYRENMFHQLEHEMAMLFQKPKFYQRIALA